jgi:predicted transcriptional regulator
MSRRVPVSIRLDDETKDRVQLLANDKGCTPHAIMREAIAEYLDRNFVGEETTDGRCVEDRL